MTDPNHEGRRTDPQHLRREYIGKILSALDPKPVTLEMLQANIDRSRETRTNLVHDRERLAREKRHDTD